VALVVTDKDLNLVEEGPVLVVHQSDAVLDGMDNWNKGTHGKSGLIDKVKASALSEADVEAQMLAFMKQHVPANARSPMCGNSICQDRRFMARHLPKLEAYFHYRNLDVSTLKELAARWRPESRKASRRPTTTPPWPTFKNPSRNSVLPRAFHPESTEPRPVIGRGVSIRTSDPDKKKGKT
jgi:oligoribonuclease